MLKGLKQAKIIYALNTVEMSLSNKALSHIIIALEKDLKSFLLPANITEDRKNIYSNNMPVLPCPCDQLLTHIART